MAISSLAVRAPRRAPARRSPAAELMRPTLSRAAGTYSQQAALPHLPLPSVEDTLKRYLASLQPLVRPGDVGAKQAFVYAANCAFDSYPELIGLNEMLKQRSPNWNERDWDGRGYLLPREPLPGTNFFLRLGDAELAADDAGHAPSARGAPPALLTPALLRRGGAILRAMTAYRAALVDEALEPAVGKGVAAAPSDAASNAHPHPHHPPLVPLDMNQAGRLFGHARLPGRDGDSLACHGPPPSVPEARHFATAHRPQPEPGHVAVLAGGHVFTVDVLSPTGAPLPAAALARSLAYVAAAAGLLGDADYPLPALTSLPRGYWAGARAALEQRSTFNAEFLKRIDIALWVVCLDATSESAAAAAQQAAAASSAEARLAADSKRLLLGRGDGADRWWDKHQLLLGADGSAALLMEHAPVDGAYVLPLAEFIHHVCAPAAAAAEDAADARSGHVPVVAGGASAGGGSVCGVPSQYVPRPSELAVPVGELLHKLHPYYQPHADPNHNHQQQHQHPNGGAKRSSGGASGGNSPTPTTPAGGGADARRQRAQMLLADTGGAARLLAFDMPAAVHDAIATARKRMAAESAALGAAVVVVPSVGSSAVKAAGLSPDSFTQVGLQLAYRLAHGLPAPQYESTFMGHFAHGRTETTRSLTPEVRAFVDAAADALLGGGNNGGAADNAAVAMGGDLPADAVGALAAQLRVAVASHAAAVRAAREGAGLDRHLFSLRNLAAATGARDKSHGPLPAIFTDPAYETSRHWRLSTSTASAPSGAATLFGFGPVVDDGYGVGYSVGPDTTTFNVTAWVGRRPAPVADPAEEEERRKLERLCADAMQAMMVGTPLAKWQQGQQQAEAGAPTPPPQQPAQGPATAAPEQQPQHELPAPLLPPVVRSDLPAFVATLRAALPWMLRLVGAGGGGPPARAA